MKILPLVRKDVPRLNEIRNLSREFLDDDRAFTVEQSLSWFDATRPEWYSIRHEGQMVGYVRTDGDSVGCDIHPDFRGRGLGRHALNWVVVRRLSEGRDVWLRCFRHNERAFKLYESLGFKVADEVTTRGLPAVRMELHVPQRPVDVLCITNKPHAADYLNFFDETARRLGTGHLTLNYKLLGNCNFSARVYTGGVDLTCGSDSHGRGVEYLACHAETEKFIICDYDVALLCPGWDRVLSYLMGQYAALGTEYPAAYQKYSGFPALFFSAWDRGTWERVRPDLSPGAYYDASLSHYSQLEAPDVGVGLPTAFVGEKSLAWPSGELDGMETYFIYGLPFVTHLGRGSHREFGRHPRAKAWEFQVREAIRA